MAQYWGYHLMLNCANCDLTKITDADHIAAFTADLVQQIDMVAYGAPQIVNFGTGNKAGYTLVQLIETSNICAHFCNDTGDVYFDIFSCKEFDSRVVKSLVYQYFTPRRMNACFVLRDAQYTGNFMDPDQMIKEIDYSEGPAVQPDPSLPTE